MDKGAGSTAKHSAARYVLLSTSGATSGLVILWLVGVIFQVTLIPAVLTVGALIGGAAGATLSAILGMGGSRDAQPSLAGDYQEIVDTRDRGTGERYMRSGR